MRQVLTVAILVILDVESLRLGVKDVDICGDLEHLTLTENGEDSSYTIDLKNEDDGRDNCTLLIKAPALHVIHLQFLEDNLEMHKSMSKAWYEQLPPAPCLLNINLPGTEGSLWSGDICGLNYLPPIDLLGNDVTLSWTPPYELHHSIGRKILVTAIGQFDVCKRPGKHICSRIGWKPHFCISDHLVCDHYKDCPAGSKTDDEDDNFCREHLHSQNSWRILFADVFNKFKPPNEDIGKIFATLNLSLEATTTRSTTPSGRRKNMVWRDWKEIHRIEGTTSPPVTESPPQSLGGILSQYGPWGYVLVAMICGGSLLIFCGLWECCVRRHKNEAIAAAAAAAATPPTAVLIGNGFDDMQVAHPPEYDDLDLPPSYAVLFPSDDKSTDGTDDDGLIALQILSGSSGSSGGSSTSSQEAPSNSDE